MTHESKDIIVIGGSVTGLCAGLALTADGHRVTILESDSSPMPEDHVQAFEKWERKGSPQVWHSHALLGKLYNLIKERSPELIDKLLACGAEELRFTDMARHLIEEPVFEPEDEKIVLLACRRITFEWVLRRHILDTGLVDFRDGVTVTGLVAHDDAATGIPRVTGVKLVDRDGSEGELSGDLVVDAGGRRSKLKNWLLEIGSKPIHEESDPCGIFYTSRFYRLRDGVAPPPLEGPIVGEDLGYLKVGLFPGDARIFSVTLAASPEDDVMRKVSQDAYFEAAAGAVPKIGEWLQPDVSEPISPVHAMSSLRDTLRRFVVDGEPVALGVVAVGDAMVHANPITGRGCTFCWMSTYMLADTLREIPDDLHALALSMDRQVEEVVVPWYRIQVQQDRDAIETERALLRGEDPFQLVRSDGTNDPRAFIRAVVREGLLPAIRSDMVVMRRFMRLMNLLDPPDDLFKDSDFFRRVLAVYNTRDQRDPVFVGPTREAMVEILQKVAA